MAKHIPQFLIPEIELSEEIFIDSYRVINHLRVLRRVSGDMIYLARGNGSKRLYSIASMDKKTMLCKAAQGLDIMSDTRNVTLIQAITDKSSMEEILAKSTELGVKEIVLFYSEYSQRFPLNKEKISSEVVAAFEQSHGYHVPAVLYYENIDEVLARYKNIIVADTVRDNQVKVNVLEAGFEVAVMIGPEGGWSETERAKFTGYQHILLSDNILRATTAATVAVGIVGYLSKAR